MRLVITLLCTASLWAAIGTSAAPPAAGGQTTAEPVTLTLDGDKVTYSADKKHVILSGNVRIRVQASTYVTGEAIIEADQVEADLDRGIISVPEGATVLAGPGLLVGDSLLFDAQKNEFTINDARGYIAGPIPDGHECEHPPVLYFQGSRIQKRGRVTNLHGGRATGCPRDNPHYYLKAKRIKFDESRGALIVYGAKLRFHGVTIPLVPWAKFGFNETTQGKGYKFEMPGYSSREGFYIPGWYRLTDFSNPLNSSIWFRITSKRGITGTAWAKRSWGSWDMHARVSRKALMADDITDQLSLDRLPQVSFTKHVRPRENTDTALTLDLDFGRFRETWEDQPPNEPRRPTEEANRALIELEYVANATQQANKLGDWYGLRGSVSTYSSGPTYRDLELFAGVGDKLSSDLDAHLTLRHHFVGGSTPFMFDDVDIKTELESGATWRVSDRWGLDAWSRFDLDQADMRDYMVTASYRADCLTWSVYYRDVGNSVGFRLDLTGLTGGTRPMQKRSSLEKEMEHRGLTVKPFVSRPGSIKIQGRGYKTPAPEKPGSDEPAGEKEM